MFNTIRDKLYAINPFYKGVLIYILAALLLLASDIKKPILFMMPLLLIIRGTELVFPVRAKIIENIVLVVMVVFLGISLPSVAGSLRTIHILFFIGAGLFLFKNIMIQLNMASLAQEKKYNCWIIAVLFIVSLYNVHNRMFLPGGFFELFPTLLLLFALWKNIQSLRSDI